ncbi:MAG: diacylglycerol kinase family protein [Clostridiales bacterium]|nr:diacylglycerol kinase family protein [Clostridiales bacterium]
MKEAWKSERSMRIHIVTAALVIVFGFLLSISTWEWIACVTLFGLVIGAELGNTALEHAVDICSPQPDPRAKRVKDIAAAAVLVVSLAAAVVGLLIFAPKVWNVFFGG